VLDRARWRTSSYSGSGGGNCAEVAATDLVLVRDTRDRQGPVLAFGLRAWQAFAAKLKEGSRR
ncbi:MAG: DUF397 domain-containing protein, partial [Streptosporangiaceae bacterium]